MFNYFYFYFFFYSDHDDDAHRLLCLLSSPLGEGVEQRTVVLAAHALPADLTVLLAQDEQKAPLELDRRPPEPVVRHPTRTTHAAHDTHTDLEASRRSNKCGTTNDDDDGGAYLKLSVMRKSSRKESLPSPSRSKLSKSWSNSCALKLPLWSYICESLPCFALWMFLTLICMLGHQFHLRTRTRIRSHDTTHSRPR